MAHTALVTGATGYVATELVSQLLQKGYHVRGSVRSSTDDSKTQTLRALADALPGTMELFEADLLQDSSFDAAVAGADYVFHTASPFFIEVQSDAHAELIQPAVDGTKNVLRSVARSKDTVKRVVLTSSVAAVVGDKETAPPRYGSTYTEEDWNTTSAAQQEHYWVSKTEAEKAAWDFAKANDISLVTILPNFVMGPVTSPTASSTSIGYFKAWLEGTAGGNPTHADVRDVARAHILAAENPAASGRYIVSQSQTCDPAEVGRWLQERFPEFDIPLGEEQTPKDSVDNSKAQRELGLAITPLKETLIDMATTLIQTGIAKPKSK